MILDELRHPIVQAPLAGGPATVALTAEVGRAGGLGFLGGAYQTPDGLRDEIRELRELTTAPFGVNLFVPPSGEVDRAAIEAYVECLLPEAKRYGAELGEPRGGDDGWDEKLALLHEETVPIVSF